jgi:flavin-binding protein dodecin
MFETIFVLITLIKHQQLINYSPLNFNAMSILKVIEVMSNSTTSWEDATQQAITEASKTLKNIRSAYVKEQTAQVVDGRVTEYRVNLKLTFEIEHKQ